MSKETRPLMWKYWLINVILCLPVVTLTGSYIYNTIMLGKTVESINPLNASPYQWIAMACTLFLFAEGKLLQKYILAKQIKKEGTHEEFALVNKVDNQATRELLDRIQKKN